jgi:hypothetical protein
MTLGIAWMILGAGMYAVHRRHRAAFDVDSAIYVAAMTIGAGFVIGAAGSDEIGGLVFIVGGLTPITYIVIHLRRRRRGG